MTYLSGEGPDQTGLTGTGIAGDTTVTRGEAWSVAADGNLLEDRLRLRGELARTRFDFDGEGRDVDLDGRVDYDAPAQEGRAHAALASFTPWHDLTVKGQPLVWSLGVENRRVGTFFRSPADPGGIADRDMWRGFSSLNWYGLDVQLVLARETDNVDDEPLLPRTRTDQTYLSVSYTPVLSLDDDAHGTAPAMPWYGQPFFNASLLEMSQDVTKAVAGLSSGALRDNRVITLGATFSYPAWSWTISHSRVEVGERTDFAPDTLSRMTQLNASFRMGGRLSLSPSVQYNEIEERDPPPGFDARDFKTTTAGLNLGYQFSDRLTTQLSYNYNHEKASDDSQHLTTKDILANLSWTVRRPRGLRPGLTLAVEGSYHDQEDRVMVLNTLDEYQVFLKATVGWQSGI